MIAKAASQQVSYDRGFKTAIASTQLTLWRQSVNDIIDGKIPDEKENPLDTKHSGSKKYTDEIEKKFPCYLVKLFRYAQKTAGAKTSFVELTKIMNDKSAIETENRDTLHLHPFQVYRWFVAKGGKETSPVEKPLDTPAHKQERKQYKSNLLTSFNITVVFQIPRTPYSNALDLGVWYCLPSRVEKNHHQKRHDLEALARTVMETWANEELNEQIQNVFKRLQKVLVLILEADGGNDLVETKRGKKFETLDLTDVNGEYIPIVNEYVDIVDGESSDEEGEE